MNCSLFIDVVLLRGDKVFTNKRLDQAFSKAPTILFDNHDKFIIFSDCHRGDNSISDEFASNQNIYLHALNYYCENGYTYIENGDGDELWEHAKYKHIRFAHSDIFEIIQRFYLKDRFYYIFGNHNLQFKNKDLIKKHLHSYTDEATDMKVDLFPKIDVHEAIILKYEPTGQELYVVHGHQGDFLNDQFWLLSKLWLRYFWRFMHIIGFHNPASPAKNIHKRHKIERKYVKWIKHSHHILVVGHTHRPKFSSPEQIPYFNSGCCVRPRSITGIEIVSGKILLVEWRIWPSINGNLQVIRRILNGPEELSSYINKF